MKLLVVGSGGREHAIAKKLLASDQVEQVFVAPGNDGMILDGIELVNIGISEHSALINFAKENDIVWTFVGPDDALAAGIVDDFEQAGLKAFGPSRLAAELEWSNHGQIRHSNSSLWHIFQLRRSQSLHRRAGRTNRGQGGRIGTGQGCGRGGNCRAGGRSGTGDALGQQVR